MQKKNDVLLFEDDVPQRISYAHRDSVNAVAIGYVGEVNDEASLTVPDEALSMREILGRYVRGLPITGGREPLFDDDYHDPDDPGMMPDLSRMDVNDRMATIDAYKSELAELQAKNTRRASDKASRDSSTSKSAGEAQRSEATTDDASVERPSDV